MIRTSIHPQVKLQEEYQNICQANEQASYNKCLAILDQLSQRLDQKVAAGAYMVPGGYKTYVMDLKAVEQQYDAAQGKGIKV